MKKGVVLYTDGGTHQSNPGPYGSGIHGYTYTFQKPKKGIGLANVIPTQLGYLDKKTTTPLDPESLDSDTLLHSKDPISVTVDSIINVFESNDDIGTNNVAEVKAMIYALSFIVKHKKEYDKFMVYSDSEYVVKAIEGRLEKWVKSNYIGTNGQPIKNREYWESLYHLLQDIKDINIEVSWIKGHDGLFGNEMADKLATIAANKSATGIKDIKEIISDNTYFNDTLDIHPLLNSKRFYFNPSHTPVPGRYYLGELGDGEDDISVGKEISDASLAIVQLKDNDIVLEAIKQKQKDWLIRRDYNSDCIIAGSLDSISTKSTYNDFYRYQEDLLKVPERHRPDLFHLLTNKPVTLVLDPPYLAMRILDQYIFLEEKARQFLSKESHDKIIDITNIFYQEEKDKKGNSKGIILDPNLSNKIKSIDIDLEDTHPGKITLTFGIDLPNRNILKRLETHHPKLHLLVWNVDPSVLGYATIITTKDDEWAIWMASYSSLYLK